MNAFEEDEEYTFRFCPKLLLTGFESFAPLSGFALGWRINDGPKQLMKAVLRGPGSKIREDGRTVIDLSAYEPIVFTQRFRIESGTNNRLEPHTLQLKVYRVTFRAGSTTDETSRERLYDRKIELRPLLKREKVTYALSIVLDDRTHHSLEVEYLVQRPDNDIELAPMPSAANLNAAAGGPSDPAAAAAAQSASTPSFANIPKCDAGTAWDNVSRRFDDARLRVRPAMQVCSISQMVDNGTRRDLDVPGMTLPLLFNLMFADGAPFPSIVHNERENARVVEGHWSVDTSDEFATKEDRYDARAGTNYNECEEVAFLFPVLVGADPQYFKVAVVHCVNSPMLDGVRIQVVTHIQKSSVGCSVSFVAYPHFISSSLKFAGQGRAQKALDKLLNASLTALRKLTAAAQRAENGAGGQEDRMSGSIHFDLWIRLIDMTNADVVDYMLSRLCVVTLTPLPTDELKRRLHALDHVLCRFPSHPTIATRILAYLTSLVAQHGASEVVRNSCIVDVVEHVDRNLGAHRRLVMELRAARDCTREALLRHITATQDPWDYVGHPHVFVDEGLVVAALERRPALTKDRLPSLTRVMGLHVTSRRVFEAVLALLAQHSAVAANGDNTFHEAFRLGLRHHPEVALQNADSVQRIRANLSTPLGFASRFASFITEDVLFSCEVTLLGDLSGSVTVFVTQHFVCFGDVHAFPRSYLVVANTRKLRSGVKPAAELHFATSINNEETEQAGGASTTRIKFSCWSRWGLFSALGIA